MELLTSADVWISFVTLLVLEVILGVDNVVFITILAGKLPVDQRAKARTLGLSLALGMRILLLFSLTWMIKLTSTLFALFGQEISGRDLILIGGGGFLLAKATYEIHERLEGETAHGPTTGAPSFAGTIVQILALDLVFSLDSVITAVGIADELFVMIAAVTLAIVLMLFTAGAIGDFVERHPTVKMLALSFLVLIGASLVAEGFDVHTPKGFVYGPIVFAIGVEMLNLRYKAVQARRQEDTPEPVHLRPAYLKEESTRSSP